MRFVPNTFLFVCCVALAGCGDTEIAAPDRPNVVLITIDTLRADRLGSYGHTDAQTPHLDRLATEGVRFEHAYAQAPLTLPSHASILSGLYPPEHGVRLNGSYSFPDALPTLATLLAEAGYDTAGFVSAYVLNATFGLARGFKTYDDRASTARVNIPERPAAETMDLALAWLRNRAESPFFLWIHLFDPHAPYEPPEPFATEFAAAPYDGEIAATDAEIGRLLAWLDERGLTDSTLIIATSDHGEGLGDHGEETHGLLIYDSTLRVPLIVRAPRGSEVSIGMPKSGRVEEAWVETIDIAPTVLAAAGVEPPAGLTGADLLAGTLPPERTGYAESMYPLILRWSPLHAWREQNWKLIRSSTNRLFDTRADPAETVNRAEAEPEAARRMENALAVFLLEAEREQAEADASPEVQHIETLGYLGGAAPEFDAVEAANWPDPAERIGVFDQILRSLDDVRRGNADAALATLTPLRESEANNPYVHKAYGRAWVRKQDYEQGVEHLTRFFELSDRSAEAAYDLALALNAAGRRDEALAVMSEGVEREPRSARSWDLLGSLQGMSGNFEAAREAGERALQLEPAAKEFHVHLGITLMNLGEFQRAEAHFRQALELDPTYSEAADKLAIAREQLERAPAN